MKGRNIHQGFAIKTFNHLLSQHAFHRPLMVFARKICPYIHKQLKGNLKELQVFQRLGTGIKKNNYSFVSQKRGTLEF
jgi:hypothetical protein